MWILGTYIDGHDLGSCLLHDGETVVVMEEERLTRIKYGLPQALAGLWADFAGRFGYFPWASVSYCLQAGGIGLDDLDALILSGDEPDRDEIIKSIPIGDPGKITVSQTPPGGMHHYCHALSTFLASPFEHAAVLVVDGAGSETEEGYEAETGYLFESRAGNYREIFKNRYAHDSSSSAPLEPGLGMTYEYVSCLLGFWNSAIQVADAGKTMGLAPYGQPSKSLEEPWIQCDGYKLDFSSFHAWLRSRGFDELVQREKARPLLEAADTMSQFACDIAYKVQTELNHTMLHLVERLHRATGEANLCLAGGVALNSVTNGLIRRRGPFERVFIQPAAGDNGQAIGLAYQGHLELNSTRPVIPIRHAFGGRRYEEGEVHSLLDAGGLAYERFSDDEALVADAVDRLASGAVIGWFQDGSEYGPRALGHRSILADPRIADMKDHINVNVKFREVFRPLAPSVLEERAPEVFELDDDSPYMLVCVQVRDAWRARIPAVTHIDGTARVQTVSRSVDPLYHAAPVGIRRQIRDPVAAEHLIQFEGHAPGGDSQGRPAVLPRHRAGRTLSGALPAAPPAPVSAAPANSTARAAGGRLRPGGGGRAGHERRITAPERKPADPGPARRGRRAAVARHGRQALSGRSNRLSLSRRTRGAFPSEKARKIGAGPYEGRRRAHAGRRSRPVTSSTCDRPHYPIGQATAPSGPRWR